MKPKKIVKRHIGGRFWVLPVGIYFIYADVAVTSVRGDGNFSVSLLLLGLFMCFWGLLGELPLVISAGRTIKWLDQQGKLEAAAEELKGDQVQVLCRNKVTLTPNFLFGKRMGVACAYEDAVWVYKQRFTQRVLFIPIFVRDSLIIETGKRSVTIDLGKKDKENELTRVIQMIYSKNPKVLVGHTEENIKAYKTLRHKRKIDKC